MPSEKDSMRKLLTIWRRTFQEFSQDKAIKLSASLAYYTIFSIAPLILVLLFSMGYVLDKEALEGQLYQYIGQFFGNDAALQLKSMVARAHLTSGSIFASIIGIATVVITSTGMFAEMQDSMNLIWGLKTKPEKGLKSLLFNRLTAFIMIFILGFILILSLILETLLFAFSDVLKTMMPEITFYIVEGINYLFALGVITLLFAIIFKVLPDAKIRWRHVRVGSLVTALLFLVGNVIIEYYMSAQSLSSVFGAAGSVIILLLWVYYSAIILYLGAEFTQVYARMKGYEIRPKSYAVFVKSMNGENGGKTA